MLRNWTEVRERLREQPDCSATSAGISSGWATVARRSVAPELGNWWNLLAAAAKLLPRTALETRRSTAPELDMRWGFGFWVVWDGEEQPGLQLALYSSGMTVGAERQRHAWFVAAS